MTGTEKKSFSQKAREWIEENGRFVLSLLSALAPLAVGYRLIDQDEANRWIAVASVILLSGAGGTISAVILPSKKQVKDRRENEEADSNNEETDSE